VERRERKSGEIETRGGGREMEMEMEMGKYV
jgi:hypothetical protein